MVTNVTNIWNIKRIVASQTHEVLKALVVDSSQIHNSFTQLVCLFLIFIIVVGKYCK